MIKAPQITGDAWFNLNSKKINKEDLEGKVVLIDFWTYSCVNCLRTLPHIKSWWNKYRCNNFLVIGVHSPEFGFEKELKNVECAINELDIDWPVVLDNDYVNWNNFANRFWPAKYLIDKDGNIVFMHFGEGSYGKIEENIRKHLKQADRNIKLPDLDNNKNGTGGVCYVPTAETYCGYSRGHISNADDYKKDQENIYWRPDILPPDSITLSGKFLAASEYVESRDINSALFLNFWATEVNLVLCPVGRKAVAEITFNGSYLDSNIAGKDVSKDGEINISECRMYNLLKSNHVVEGILGIKIKKGSFRAYVFTFSGCLKN